MLKVASGFIILLLLVGCNQKSGGEVPIKIFQSVDEREAILLQEGKEKRSCHVCGMDLVKFYKTSHSAEENGKNYQYCSIHCLENHLQKGVSLRNPKVVDIVSLKFIDASKAFYVVGSNKRATMSRVSKYAFLHESDAKFFQAQFGGEIMNFENALQKAKEDFKSHQ